MNTTLQVVHTEIIGQTQLLNDLKSTIETVPMKPTEGTVIAKSVPAVSPFYVVRERVWNHMLLHLVEPRPSKQIIVPITGMGGCGKTQTVSYFLQEKGDL